MKEQVGAGRPDSRLNGRDLINVGVYTAIYFVITIALSMTGLIPIFLVMLSSLMALAGGIPFMLFLTKVKKPGMIFIMSTIMGIMMFITGMTWMPMIFSMVTGLLAEMVYRRGRYDSVRSAALTSGVFSLWACGNYLPLFLQRDEYFASRSGYGQEYIDAVMRYTPDWMFFVLLISTFICGLVGGLLGKALLKKHFRRGGIA